MEARKKSKKAETIKLKKKKSKPSAARHSPGEQDTRVMGRAKRKKIARKPYTPSIN